MKNFKNTTLIFLLLFSLIISLGFVSASEDMIDAVSDDNVDLDDSSYIKLYNDELNENFNEEVYEQEVMDEEKSSNENSKGYLSNSLGNSVYVNGSTFEDIQNVINKASSGDTIYLNGTYVSNGRKLNITKSNLTFCGVGETFLISNLSSGSTNTGSIILDNNLNYYTFINLNFLYPSGTSVFSFRGNNNTFINCSFETNMSHSSYAVYRPAFFIRGNYNFLINCTFKNNYANYSEGAAIYFFESRYCSLINCSFLGNSAYDPINSGAICFTESYNCSLINCSFINNTAYNYGGAIFFNNSGCILKNCTFLNNYAWHGSDIFLLKSNVTLDGCYYEFMGGNNFLANNFSNLIVIKRNATLSYYSGDLEFYYKNFKPITIQLKDGSVPLYEKYVSVYLDNEKYLGYFKTDINGLIPISDGLNNLSIGNHTLDFYLDSCAYNDCYLKINLDVLDNVETEITASDVNVAYDFGLLEVFLSYDNNPIANKEINVQVADKTFNIITNIFGVASFDIGKLNLENGNYAAYLTFDGSGDYKPSESNCTIRVNNDDSYDSKINSSLSISLDNISLDQTKIDFTLTDDEGNLITNNLSVFFNNENYTVEVLDGEGSLNVTDLIPNDYSVFAYYKGDKKYNSALAYSQFKLSKRATKIIFEDMITTAVDTKIDGRIGEYFIWRLVDQDNNPIANTPMQIGFNGVVYDEKNGIVTDENGFARLQINLGYKNTYTFAICFLGDENYNGSFVVSKITVNTQTGSLTVPNKSYSASAKTKSLTATFKTSKGNAVANKKVSFTVNGKTYTAKTNDKGMATVNVSLSKKGTYNVTAKFAGDSTYSEMTKTAKLTIK